MKPGLTDMCLGLQQDASPCWNVAVATVRYTCTMEVVRERRYCQVHVKALRRGHLTCSVCLRDGNGMHSLILLQVLLDRDRNA